MSYEENLRQQISDAVDHQFPVVKQDPYYPGYHLAPPAGLLNDPNGWIQWNGNYHLFFQWMPFHTGHGAKFWGHFRSENLIDWKLEPVALAPSDWFDKNGCYSGSAIADEDKLKVFYTGNVKNERGERQTYQCLAESADGIQFEKKGVKVPLPEGYTPHFRDPKVWKYKDHWYMVIGAQSTDKKGCVAFLESSDLENWTHRGVLSDAEATPFNNLGYMWECPDLFSLGGSEILLFSPQGLAANGIDFNNQYQSGYVVGSLDYSSASFSHSDFEEVDRGFEFYAPQTTLDDQGRRLLVGWMGVPDQNESEQPTVSNGWVHQMTLPRQLELKGEKLYQLPLEEMKKLRIQERYSQTVDSDLSTSLGRTAEIEISGEIEELHLFDYAKIMYDRDANILHLERLSYVDGTIETRSCRLPNGFNHLRLFVDHSSLEIFVNKGEEVFTSRIFAEVENDSLKVSTKNTIQLQVWDLKNDTIHIRD
ncbi:sucrose-6-phosphate hydrolase [Halobacillus sp. B23F22_1]|uniref:sucrose-6-phosphate hydrolase n=1 Tax=Halobacillus sp. B23F22_1 TaxID=3459514 RepID=UPI00373EBEAA